MVFESSSRDIAKKYLPNRAGTYVVTGHMSQRHPATNTSHQLVLIFTFSSFLSRLFCSERILSEILYLSFV